MTDTQTYKQSTTFGTIYVETESGTWVNLAHVDAIENDGTLYAAGTGDGHWRYADYSKGEERAIALTKALKQIIIGAMQEGYVGVIHFKDVCALAQIQEMA